MSEPVIPARILFRERVLPSPLGWAPLLLLGSAIALVLAPITGASVGMVAAGFVVGLAAALIWAASPVIELTNLGLRVGTAAIPVELLGEATAISKQQSFEERGPKLDARAFIRFQVTVATLCKIEIADRNDPTPYWLFSSRRGEELARLLNAPS